MYENMWKFFIGFLGARHGESTAMMMMRLEHQNRFILAHTRKNRGEREAIRIQSVNNTEDLKSPQLVRCILTIDRAGRVDLRPLVFNHSRDRVNDSDAAR